MKKNNEKKKSNFRIKAFDKMNAHCEFCAMNDILETCPFSVKGETTWANCKLRDLCFNAWLHSNREGDGK